MYSVRAGNGRNGGKEEGAGIWGEGCKVVSQSPLRLPRAVGELERSAGSRPVIGEPQQDYRNRPRTRRWK